MAVAAMFSFALTGCAGSSSGATSANAGGKFSNVLVIGTAGSYDVRAQFERQIVSNIRKTGASASAWYSVIGGDKAVTEEDVIRAVDDRGFDAVLVIRQLDGEIALKVKKSRAAIDNTPLGERIVNLFRSSDTDYTKAGSIDIVANALLTVELYGVESGDIVFSFDHQTKKESNIGLLIDQTAETIVRRVDTEGLLAN